MDALADEDDAPEGYACPCLVYVSAGEPSIDCCSDLDCEGTQHGMLTAHVEDVYPSNVFPAASEDFEPCKAATWVAQLVITAARCAPTVDEEGNLAPAAELSANASLMAFDQYAILTALGCCLVAEPVAGKSKRRVQIQGSRPLTSEGGCASVEVRALVEVGQVCACVETS